MAEDINIVYASHLKEPLPDSFITDLQLKGIHDLIDRNIRLLLDQIVNMNNVVIGKDGFAATQRCTGFHRTGHFHLLAQTVDRTCVYRKAFGDFPDRDMMIKGLDN